MNLTKRKFSYLKLKKKENQLKKYADDLQRVVDNRTRELREANNKLREANDKMKKDMESARVIQEALLPSSIMDFGNANFNSKYIPCQDLSGDFYNYFKIDDEHIGVYIIDVSGHGISAAMLTIFISRSLKWQILSCDEKVKNIDPSVVMTNLYELFNNSKFPDSTYVVMLYGIYNIKEGIFTYSTAGHNCPPILMKKNNKIEVLDQNKGFPICKLGDIYTPIFQDYEIKLSKGDRIFFYTDGITELKNEDGEAYTIDRLENLLEQNKDAGSSKLINSIDYQLNKYKNFRNIEDDITFFIMEITK